MSKKINILLDETREVWDRFYHVMNIEFNQIDKRTNDVILYEISKLEVLDKLLSKDNINVDYLLKYREKILEVIPELSNEYTIIDTFDNKENRAVLSIAEKIKQVAKNTVNKLPLLREDFFREEVKMKSLDDMTSEKKYNFNYMKELLKKYNFTKEESLKVFKYAMIKARVDTDEIEKKNEISKFKKQIKEENEAKKKKELEEIKKLEEARKKEKYLELLNKRKGIQKSAQQLLDKYYRLLQEFEAKNGHSNIKHIEVEKNAYNRKEVQALKEYQEIMDLKKDIDETFELLKNDERDNESLEYLDGKIKEFQSHCSVLSNLDEKISEKEEFLSNDNKNVYFLIQNPDNLYLYDKAGVYGDLTEQKIDESFFIKNRTKHDIENLEVAGKLILFRQYHNRSVISFIRACGHGEDSKILVLASTPIKNKGTDKINDLTRQVCKKNEQLIESCINSIEKNDPEFIQIQAYCKEIFRNRKSVSEENVEMGL